MPNIELINELMDEIEAEQIAVFDMTEWLYRGTLRNSIEIGDPRLRTCGCIMGFVDLIKADGDYDKAREGLIDEGEELGISQEVAYELFYARHSRFPLQKINVEMTLRALEDLKTDNFKSWKDYA